MADSTVASLSAASTLDGTELYYGVQGGGNVKVTGSQIKTLTSASPTLVTPTLGVATATSINKVIITTPATGSTLTVVDGKTFTVSNTLTITGTDNSSVAFGSGGTVTYTSNDLSVFSATTSAQLAGVISDETGTGSLVFGTSPGFTTAANPATDSAADLGTTSLKWGSLFLKSGGVINFNSGNVTITHSSGILTFSGGVVLAFASRTRIASPADAQIQFRNSAQSSISNLSIPANNTLVVGAVASATPASNTLGVGESSRGGTDSNVAGANGTIQSGAGTGTGTVTSLILSTPTVAASGTTQQTLATRLTLSSAGVVVASGMVFQIGNAATTGLTAGVLAALTNATIVITDSTGQAYRIPCII